MSDISLTASMRTNLLSLQNTQSLMDRTQERLSTGKKVNSAIDNPSSYYTAQGLTNRASDLDALLDSMGQGIQTLKAANEGIESITAFVQQAKAVATTARDTASRENVSSSGSFVNRVPARNGAQNEVDVTLKVGDKVIVDKLDLSQFSDERTFVNIEFKVLDAVRYLLQLDYVTKPKGLASVDSYPKGARSMLLSRYRLTYDYQDFEDGFVLKPETLDFPKETE